MRRTCSVIAILSAVVFATPACAADDLDFDAVSIEDLTSMEVVTAAKRPQWVGDTASAIHVITAEDMLRAGHTSVP